MTISARCLVCRNPDRRRLIELGWNGGMSGEAIARVLDQKGLVSNVIIKHLKEHADGDPNLRAVVIEPVRPARERVLELQRMQLDEVERRIALAKERAALVNASREGKVDAKGEPLPMADWSEYYDILGKDAQAAIGSILKTQGLSDRREKTASELKLGLFEAMTNAGLAPKALVGGVVTPALQSGEEIEGE